MHIKRERVCRDCGGKEPSVTFTLRTVNGRQYKTNLCRLCHNADVRKRYALRGGRRYTDEQKRQKNAVVRSLRASGVTPERWILNDSRRDDKKYKRDNNLDREFIRKIIATGCCYCGETSLRMTLDRVDNNRGHTKDNVVPACIRCNYTRKDMPYKAWCIIAPCMRTARNQGLFGDRTGRAR